MSQIDNSATKLGFLFANGFTGHQHISKTSFNWCSLKYFWARAQIKGKVKKDCAFNSFEILVYFASSTNETCFTYLVLGSNLIRLG